MEEKKISITFSVIEMGIDIARDFVDKLIAPAIEETGLLLKDQATGWRFNNQLNILIFKASTIIIINQRT